MRRLARLLVALTAPPDRAAAMVGDLEEEHDRRRGRDGAAAALRWYWRQALRSVAPNLAWRLRRWRARLDGSDHAKGDGMGTMGRVLQDVRYGIRSLGRHPAFTGTVVLTLALGIAANATIFAVVDGLILNPFPFPDADRVVGVGSAYPRLGEPMGFFENLSPAEYVDVAESATTLVAPVAWDMGNRQIDGEGPPQNVFTAFWWGDPLEAVGMAPHLGRSFTERETRDGAPVAMLSHRLWRSRFGADSSLVGETLSIGGEPHTLVGIAPEGVLIYGTDLWTPMWAGPEELPRNRRQFQLMARLAPGATLERANAELEGIARRVEAEHGSEHEEYGGWRLEARPWAAVTSATFRTAGFVLMAAVGMVLLLVCANVANLLLVRSVRRRREMAVRRAMGADGGRLVRQLLIESGLLALLGGAVGLLLATAGVRGIRDFLDRVGIPFLAGRAEVSATVVGFTLLVAAAAGLLFGLVPALRSARAGVRDGLRASGGGATSGRGGLRLQKVLVGAEVALALALLGGGGLLTNSMLRAAAVDPGVAADEVLSMRLTLPWTEYDLEGVRIFFDELVRRTEGLPGVISTAAASQIPPAGFSRARIDVDGGHEDAEGSLPTALTTVVTPGYFETVGTPVRAGRGFSEEDGSGARPVTVLNQTAARRFFPGGDALGGRVRLAEVEGAPWFTVVGIAADARNRGLDAEPGAEVFVPQAQAGGGNQLFLLLRTRVEPAELVPAIRRTVAELDPDQPIYAIQTLERAFESGGAPRRAAALFLALFAGFAVLLAATGVYAVVAHAVGRRTREIGLRVALGASPAGVRRMVVAQALVPVGLGLVAGVVLAALLGRAMSGMLVEIDGSDPATLASVTALLLVVAAGASWIPARRAAGLDPGRTLRSE